MDDSQNSYRSPDMENVVQNLQICIDNLQKQADENRFKFSSTKTAMLSSKIKNNTTPSLILTKKGIQIRKVDNFKLLGKTWDSEFNWKLHLTKLKFNCNHCSYSLSLYRCLPVHRPSSHKSLELIGDTGNWQTHRI